MCQLHCETLPSGLRRSSQRLADVPRRASRIKGRAVTVSSRLFRSLRLLHNRQLTVLIYALPASHREENNRPGAPYRRDCQCPESAYINIIPSGLCNSRRHRQCPASRASVKHTPGARPSDQQGVRLHNPDYVKYAPSVSCESPASELPGEAAAGKRPPSRTSGLQARQGAAHFALALSTGIKTPAPLPQSSPPQAPETTASAPFFELSVGKCSRAQSAATQSRCATRTTSPAFSVSAVRASCRLRQLRCWVVPCRDSSSSAGSVRRVPSLHSAVSLRLGHPRPLFLHTSGGANPARSVPGSREAAVPAAGADSVGIPLRSTRHRLRRSDSARLRLEPHTFDPAVGRPGPGR